jgi:hypothetical protein
VRVPGEQHPEPQAHHPAADYQDLGHVASIEPAASSAPGRFTLGFRSVNARGSALTRR